MIRRNSWTDSELSILRACYPLGQASVCAALPHRSWDAICKRASIIGLRSGNGHRRKYDEATIDLMLADYIKMTGKQCAAKWGLNLRTFRRAIGK